MQSVQNGLPNKVLKGVESMVATGTNARGGKGVENNPRTFFWESNLVGPEASHRTYFICRSRKGARRARKRRKKTEVQPGASKVCEKSW